MGWATAAVLVLLVLALAVPVNLLYALKREGEWQGRIVIYWLFGLVHLSFRPGRRREGSTSRRRPRPTSRIFRGGKRLIKGRCDLLAVMRTPGFARRVVDLVGGLLEAARPRRLRIHFIIGMEDPADTGRLWAILGPLRLLFRKTICGRASGVAIEISPDFSGPRFKGYSCASLRFVPLEMIGLVVGFLFSAPALRAARVLIRRSGASAS
jgi:hypothetical protein